MQSLTYKNVRRENRSLVSLARVRAVGSATLLVAIDSWPNIDWQIAQVRQAQIGRGGDLRPSPDDEKPGSAALPSGGGNS